MVNLMQEAGFSVPDVSNFGTWIVYFLIGILVAILVSIGIFLFIQNLKFNRKIVLFKKISGKTIPVGQDKGMLERVGIAGDSWLRTKKMKKIIPRPKIWVDKNTAWFFEREDGEWINFGIEDIDGAMKEAKAYYVDEDMRLQRLGIQRNLKDRFDKPGFWEKYGAQIMMVIFFLIVTICLIVIFNKMNDLIKALPQLASALRDLANAIASAQGSGMVPVNSTGVPL